MTMTASIMNFVNYRPTPPPSVRDRAPKKIAKHTPFFRFFNNSTDRSDCGHANLTKRIFQLTFCGAKTLRPRATVRPKKIAKKPFASAFLTARPNVGRVHANLIIRLLQLTFCGAKAVRPRATFLDRLPKKFAKIPFFFCFFNSSTDHLDRDHVYSTKHHLQLTFCGAKTVRPYATVRSKKSPNHHLFLLF